MTTANDGAPIACTLRGVTYDARLAWIARLNHDGLRGQRRHAASLELDYDASVRDRVEDLVRQEAECCAFLHFAVEETTTRVRVTITVPAHAEQMADALLAPFVGARSSRSASDPQGLLATSNARP